VNVQLVLSMMMYLNNVFHVLTCVLYVVLMDVNNVVVTESPLIINVSVLTDIMKMLNVNVQHVIINVLNVLLILAVMNVLLIESKKMYQLVHVQLELIMLIMLLNVLLVITNVVLVLTTVPVLNVVKTESTSQLVNVCKDTMK
jgi:hypothetical protein